MGTTQSSSDAIQLSAEIKKLTEIKFYVQDLENVVKGEDIHPNTTLNFYLRKILKMTGTKGMCYEGGCGSCVVVLQHKDSVTKQDVFLAVNSCLIPLLACNGWRIYTIEGIGNPLDGYHPIQEILAKFNGTQCGFCSPGMVMNMYALYESGKLTVEQVENSFGGNICRCTGYRPILSAFKTLCKDASPELLGEYPDIEDLIFCHKKRDAGKCTQECEKTAFYLSFPSFKWIKVHTLRDLLATLNLAKSTYRLVAGNTAQGVYKSYNEDVDLYLDINDVPELKIQAIKGDSCILGANITLTDTIEFFKQTAENHSEFGYLKLMADHIDLVANVPVRNRGTIAGNLMIKHDHHEFPSDIFLILETVGAVFTIVDLNNKESKLSPLKFINHNMRYMVLKSISLKAFSDTCKYVSYKIMPRAQNVHALVNAGFLFKFGNNNQLNEANVVYGNINPAFVHARQTENFFVGKNLFDNSVLKQAYKILSSELTPDFRPPEPTPKMRKTLAIGLLYKAVLNIAPTDKVSPKNKSGGTLLQRPISTGAQDYGTNKSLYPLTEAIPKIEALAQTSGQAMFIVDMPDVPFQLFGALVLAKAPSNSVIRNIDATRALRNEGIVSFYSAKDIPGNNNFTYITPLWINSEEEIFCTRKVKYYEQPIGILIGNSREAAEKGTGLVEVHYDYPDAEPLITVRQILKKGRNDRIDKFKTITRKRKGNDVKHVVKGSFDIYHQYHFHMETQCCNVVPTEDGLEVYSSTQWMDLVQFGISKMLNIPKSKIVVTVRRCGGAFGAKISRAGQVACAAALASWMLRKPVKLWLPLTTNMAAIGKRFPLSTDYEVGVDDKGVIQYMECSHYTDVGYQFNEDVSILLEKNFMTIYTSDTFAVELNRAVTDTHSNTWMRAPGTTEGLAALETIMEHISYVAKVDPLDLRLANLSDKTPLARYIKDIKSWADIDQRKTNIANFNKLNRWKKKGLAVTPMSFDMILVGPYLVTVSILHGDGSVQISHGGIEIGQGINTKAAQTCAYLFQIPLEKIQVLPSNSFISANTTATGASLTGDGVCYGVIQACNELLARIKPYQSESSKWEDVIKKSYENFVNLVATGLYSPKESDVHPYSVYGVCATEVLVDILTGQHLITRVDLIEDTGVSLNPIVDIGQVEGAFVMGIGYYTTEKIVFNYEGKILTNNTWTYFPPGARDIPVDFRVKFPKGNPNPVGVLKSKGTGEPAMSLAVSVPLAIRNALASARTDASASNLKWYPIDGTTDVENVLLNTLNDKSQYVL